MPKSDLEFDFPLLIGKEYELSPESFNYNCLGYVLGDESHWWEPPRSPGQYWPPGFPDDTTISTVESIIKLHGYTIETECKAMPETEAIAIYGQSNEWNGLISRDSLVVPGRAN